MSVREEKKVDEKIIEEREKELAEKLANLEEREKAIIAREETATNKEAELKKSEESIAAAEAKLKETEALFSDEKLKKDSLTVRDKLNKQKKVNIRIPKSELNPGDLNVPVTIGGYTYNILRGVDVEVPQEVANILKESGYLG